jgi:hypothetical protein
MMKDHRPARALARGAFEWVAFGGSDPLRQICRETYGGTSS